MKRRSPTLAASFTASADAPSNSGCGTLSAWCGHCERLHHHGAAGRGRTRRREQRGSHCDPDSPLAGSAYVLTIGGGPRSDAASAIPNAPMVSLSLRLRDLLDQRREDLSRTVLLATVGPGAPALHRVGEAGLTAQIGPARLVMTGWGAIWQLEHGMQNERGSGLLGLLSRLFAISPGIAGRRILETVTSSRFPPRAALEVEAVIDRWADQIEVVQ